MYLLAVKHLQIESGLPNPFLSNMPRLEYVITGVKCEEAEKGAGSRTRLPITPDILHKLKRLWEEKANEWDTRMIWAACLLCFFAIMRIGELHVAVPSDSRFYPKVHLSFKDTSLLRLTIKTSKTYQEMHGSM